MDIVHDIETGNPIENDSGSNQIIRTWADRVINGVFIKKPTNKKNDIIIVNSNQPIHTTVNARDNVPFSVMVTEYEFHLDDNVDKLFRRNTFGSSNKTYPTKPKRLITKEDKRSRHEEDILWMAHAATL
jgi:hypothetical protein